MKKKSITLNERYSTNHSNLIAILITNSQTKKITSPAKAHHTSYTPSSSSKPQPP